MKIKFFIIIVLFISEFSCFSQTDLNKIVGEYIFRKQKNNLLSNEKGNFTINFDVKFYVINKTGYFVKNISKSDLLKSDTVFLVQQPVQLNEVSITSKKLEEVVKDKHFYVEDYIVLPVSCVF